MSAAPLHNKPPRSISPVASLLALHSNASLQVGWFIFGFGMIFFWIFFMNSEILSLSDGDDWIQTTGVITRVSPTNFSENESTVWKLQYDYQTANKTYQQTAYGTGMLPKEGESVQIEYDPQEPYMARIPGYNRRPFGPFAALVAIFPLLGLAFMIWGYKKTSTNLHLLTQGHFTTGTLIDKQKTNTTVNEERVYKLTFEFQDERGQTYQTYIRSHQPEKLLDEVEEPLLYLASHPEKAVMYDSITPKPTFSDGSRGNQLTFPGSNLKVFFLPTLVLLGHGIYVWFRYFA